MQELFQIPSKIEDYLRELNVFIDAEIRPLEQQDDNIRFFDHRRENARTDWEKGGLPAHDWEMLLAEARKRADAAGHFRFQLPEEFGGKNGGNLAMARIREHFAAKGLGLHNDLQNEHSIVGNLVQPLMVRDFGTKAQKQFIEPMCRGEMIWSFGLTEAEHGSDATWMETRAVRRPATVLMAGSLTEARCGRRVCMSRPTSCVLRAIRARTATPKALAVLWSTHRQTGSKLASIFGLSTCRRIIRPAPSKTCSCRTIWSWATLIMA